MGEHQEHIEEQGRKALKEEALQLVKKKPRNEDNQEKEVINNSNEEVSLGDFIGAMGSLMTAFAPKEDAEKLQGQVDQMAQMLSTVMVSTEGTKTSSTKISSSMENIKHETKSEDQSSFLVAKTNILNSYEITLTGIKDLSEGIGNTTHAEVTKPDGSKEKIFVWIYPEYKYQEEKQDLSDLWKLQQEFGTREKDKTYDKEIFTVRDDKIVDVNKGQMEETYLERWMVGYTDGCWKREVANLVSYLESNGVITEVPHIKLDTDYLNADAWHIAASLAPLTLNLYMYNVG